MKKGELKDLYGHASVPFRAQVENALAQIEEEENMKKRYKLSIVLIAAALVVLMAGGALAMGSGLMEYLNRGWIKPLDGAEDMLQSNLGSMENDLLAVSVEEALYDGHGMTLYLRISPKDTERHALLSPGLMNTPDNEYIVERIPMEDDPEIFYEKIIGHRDGKEILFFSLFAEQTPGEGEASAAEFGSDNFYLDTAGEITLCEDGSVLVPLTGFSDETLPEKLSMRITCQYGFGFGTEEYRPEKQYFDFEIELSGEARTLTITPVGSGEGERFKVLGGQLNLSPVSGYMTLDYLYLPDEEAEPMGIDFILYDADGNRIQRGGGNMNEEPQADGWLLCHENSEIQSYEEFPEIIYLESSVIGEGHSLGRVECRVTAD